MNVQIAQRLAELRRAHGYSQEALANELELSRQAVSKWERAESSPDTENLIALAHLYGVSLDALLSVDDDVAEDVAFEHEERAREQDAAERAREHDRASAAQAAEAAARASQAAAQAAQAAADMGEQARHLSGGGQPRGRWRSFPYGVAMTILFFLIVLGTGGAGGYAILLFLTIPIYRWVANILDEHERRAGLDAPADDDEGRE